MAEVHCRLLNEFHFADLERIGASYTTTEKYVVRKTETDERTELTFELVHLPEPVIKPFPRTSDVREYYDEIALNGLSAGAYMGDEMVGIALADAQQWNGTLLLWEFHIVPELRGQGIGRRMMQLLVERAQSASLRVISAETSNLNVPAIRFYRKVGFTIDAIDLSFYGNDDLERGEVALFMKRRL